MSLSLPEALFFVGIDWATEIHAVCVLDPAGKQVAAFPVAHTADGLARLIAALAGLVTRLVSPSRSSGRTGGWSMCCWRPGTRRAGEPERDQDLAGR